ncbi:Nramp family divalent metal transporter [Microlunatus panaciterrae]|nr:Nramp family divalent metal transporter [Microlunatus panaciterrae]
MLQRSRALLGRYRLLGPAFVAAVAYVDPGNVATNTSAGARYGYLLLWVLVGATLMAGLVQYLSAKVGLLTGESLPSLVAGRHGRIVRLAYWLQAELVAVATDLAEIVGGAIALRLLFDLPLVVGALITTTVSTAMLLVQDRRGQRTFERVIASLLAVITIGFLAGLVIAPPRVGGVLSGLLPRLQGADSVLLAVGMLGATVMPHAIYLHSALVRDRHGRVDAREADSLLRAVRLDVVLAMMLAGSVNIGMLLIAASALFGQPGVDTLEGAQSALGQTLGPVIALLFALALLASGLASTSVGGYAGAVIMAGLLHSRVPLLWRRVLTAVPALLLLAGGMDATRLLILSQVILSFGIPFALVPLVSIARDRQLMALAPTHPVTLVIAWVVVGVVVFLNAALLFLTVAPLVT